MIAGKDKEIAVDVVVMPDPYASAGTSSQRIEFFEYSHRLFEDLWLAKFNPEFSKAVMVACTAPGENLSPSFWTFGGPYGFVRVSAPDEDPYKFDPDGRLANCIALSRLAQPTSLGFEYAARVRRRANGSRMIIPARPTELNPHAFVSAENLNWLTPGDLSLITALVESYFKSPPPKRVDSAFWYFEAASRSFYVDHRWPLLVAGLEALVRVSGEKNPKDPNRYPGSTDVFAKRLAQISTMLQQPVLAEQTLRDIYKRRSNLVHGQGLGQIDGTMRMLYDATELLLRTILRRAMLDGVFAALFASDQAVKQGLPLV